MVDRERLRALCLDGPRAARSNSDHFIPPHVLQVALYNDVDSLKTVGARLDILTWVYASYFVSYLQ